MSQVNNRNSSAAKRARTDGSRREDDWTCPSCGNSSAAKPLRVPQNYLSSAPYVDSGAPSSMYLGVPPYGSSLFNGSCIPPYDVPFSGGSAYHYNYGSRLSGGSPYRPLHMSGPPPNSSGMYGMPPLMDRYGLGLPMGPPPMGPSPGFFPDDKSQKKGVEQKMPEGSWKCEKCSNINYPSRTKCNRQNCGADKPAESKNSPSPTANENDQFFSAFLSIDLQLSTVPVSTRTCLKVEKVCPVVVLMLWFCGLYGSLVHYVSAILIWKIFYRCFSPLLALVLVLWSTFLYVVCIRPLSLEGGNLELRTFLYMLHKSLNVRISTEKISSYEFVFCVSTGFVGRFP
ncbi:hypothetical protein CRYUN_Cryun29cG0064900 [Craigia yunnanensis]